MNVALESKNKKINKTKQNKNEGDSRAIAHWNESAKKHCVCTTKWLLLPSCLPNSKDLPVAYSNRKPPREGILGKALQPSQVDTLQSHQRYFTIRIYYSSVLWTIVCHWFILGDIFLMCFVIFLFIFLIYFIIWLFIFHRILFAGILIGLVGSWIFIVYILFASSRNLGLLPVRDYFTLNSWLEIFALPVMWIEVWIHNEDELWIQFLASSPPHFFQCHFWENLFFLQFFVIENRLTSTLLFALRI